MKLSIANSTGHYKNDDIYFGIIGEQSGKWGFINSNGSWQQAPPISQKVNVPFFNLASQPSLTLSPPIISGRCWLSIGQPLTVPIWDSGFTGPAFNAATDPNYHIIFDKFEFTYDSNKTIFCNTTSVDFFGLPITAKLIGNKSQTVGISVPRSQVFKAFQETPPFDSLIRTVGNTQLRILAPQKDSTFDPTYFDPYIVQSWQQYQSQSLTLQPLPYNGTTYISTGRVDANNVFNFVTTPGNTKHTIQKPTSTDVFGCAGVFNPTGSGLARIIDGDIKNQVSSALNRTILLNSDSSTWCDGSKYYLNSITNYYAKILHELSINGKSYAFPYDDKCDHSSTLVDTSPTEIVLTLTAFFDGEPSTKKVALKADNGQYVSADFNQGGTLVANRDVLDDWETFELIKLDGNKIGLRADNGQYVSADFNQGGTLVANRDVLDDWETFELIKLDGNKIGLRADNGQYVSADFNQGGILVANRDVLDGWETFELIVNSSPPTGNGFVNIVSRQFYEAMFPNRNSFYSYDALVSATQKYPSFCNEGSDEQRKREAAAFLANITHETGALQHVEELNQANWPHYCDRANKTYPCVQGKTYHGRGPIQLSWNYNYGACGEAIGMDLLNNPELVSTNSSISFMTALWFWMTPQGRENLRCHDAIRNFGFGKTISIINGGLECGKGQVTPQAQHRIQLYEQFTRELGVTPGENLSC